MMRKPTEKLAAKRSKLDDYVMGAEIGRGSFAKVFRVTRKRDNIVYAMKRVRLAGMKQREVADTLSEVRFLASVKHPNLIRYFDSFYHEPTEELCIVMEMADGGDLSKRVERCVQMRTRLRENDVWTYLIQLLDALAYLHRKKIVHRDLKTANCFLMADGQLKLGDFNVAKLAKLGMMKTQIGTPYFMSPEIWRKKPYGPPSDIWSLGCIAYELCALRPPFRGRDMDDLSRRVLAGAFPRIPAEYSSQLMDFISSMLQQDPTKRPTVAQLLESPEVTRRRAFMAELIAATSGFGAGDMKASVLLGTIAVPHRPAEYMMALADALPAAQFPPSPARALDAGMVSAPSGKEVADADFVSIGVRDSRVDKSGKPIVLAAAHPRGGVMQPAVMASPITSADASPYGSESPVARALFAAAPVVSVGGAAPDAGRYAVGAGVGAGSLAAVRAAARHDAVADQLARIEHAGRAAAMPLGAEPPHRAAAARAEHGSGPAPRVSAADAAPPATVGGRPVYEPTVPMSRIAAYQMKVAAAAAAAAGAGVPPSYPSSIDAQPYTHGDRLQPLPARVGRAMPLGAGYPGAVQPPGSAERAVFEMPGYSSLLPVAAAPSTAYMQARPPAFPNPLAQAAPHAAHRVLHEYARPVNVSIPPAAPPPPSVTDEIVSAGSPPHVGGRFRYRNATAGTSQASYAVPNWWG